MNAAATIPIAKMTVIIIAALIACLLEASFSSLVSLTVSVIVPVIPVAVFNIL